MSATKAAAPYYYVPGPSRWPVMAGMSLLATMIGASAWVNSLPWGMPLNLIGIAATVVVLYFWFGDAIAESRDANDRQHPEHGIERGVQPPQRLRDSRQPEQVARDRHDAGRHRQRERRRMHRRNLADHRRVRSMK